MNDDNAKERDQSEAKSNVSTSTGYLTPDRLALIPPEFHARHEFLIFSFDLIQEIVIDTQNLTARRFSFTPAEIPGFDADAFKADPVGYAATNCPQAKEPILLDVALALAADFYSFVHHALTAFERRQFTVGYASLRKPFKENLLLLCWLAADHDEFFDRFLMDPVNAFNSGALSPEKRSQIFQKAIAKEQPYSKFPWDVVENFIFRKEFTHSLAPTFDKAMHLVTSKEHMRTEDMNFNFIFKNPNDDDVYSTDYISISLVLLFSLLVIFSVFDQFDKKPKNYEMWMLLAPWSACEAIFQNRKSDLFGTFEKTCANSLKCMYCSNPFEITVSSIPKFVMTERISCTACKRDQQFPLQWLFCHESNPGKSEE